MKLFLFRLSLKTYDQLTMFPALRPGGSSASRETWLRDRLSVQLAFMHRGNEFYFVPENSRKGLPDEINVGWIARTRAVNERTPPWDGLSTTEHESWQAALILVDPRHHLDAQKVAMETRQDVGAPASILLSLFKALSPGEEEPYSVTVFPILEGRTFAEFALEHPKTISSITYEASVPNMFGGLISSQRS